MPTFYSAQPDSTELAGLVHSIWSYRSDMDFEYERILPGISSQLLINLHENELRHWEKPGQLRRTIGPLGVQGILTEPILIDTEQKQNLCGVVFTSFGLSAFCETDAIRFTDTIVDASELWGSAAIKLRNRLLKETDQAQMCRTVEQFCSATINLAGRIASVKNVTRLASGYSS